MHLVVVGVNHNTAPVELRERLALDKGELGLRLTQIRSTAHIAEACIVSTCNRTEIYAVTHSRYDDDILIEFLADYGEIDHTEIQDFIYRKPGHHAIKHLFEVASGLDSMAIGEYQILGQIRNAYCIADENGSTGTILNNIFQQAISVGKRARTETGISNGSLSIGSSAVELAKSALGDLIGRKVLLLGSGKMGSIAATHLKSSGVEQIYIASRTIAKVRELTDQLDGIPIEFDRFEEVLGIVDVVICSTSARGVIINKEIMQRAMQSRDGAPIMLIDIAVPRDVEPDVADIDGVCIYNIDDLKSLVCRCKDERKAEVDKVRAIVQEEISSCMTYLKTLEAVPMIKQLRAKFESVYMTEWEKLSPKLAHLSDEDKQIIQRSLKSTVAKLIHTPILQMKDFAANSETNKLDIIQELFDLGSDADSIELPILLDLHMQQLER